MKFIDKFTTKSKSDHKRNVTSGKKLELTRYYQAPAGDEVVRLSQETSVGVRAWVLRITAIFLLILITWLLLGLHRIELRPVKTDALRRAADYNAMINSELKLPPLHLKFLFDAEVHTKQLMEQYPEISNVTWSNPVFGTTASVKVDICPPRYILENSSGSYIVNDQGKIIGKANDSYVMPTYKIIDQTGFGATIGRNVVSAKDAQYFEVILSQLAAKNIVVESFILPPLAGEVHVKVNQPYIIKFSLSSDAAQSVGGYLAMKQRLMAESKQPKEYIDVRAGERIFVR